MTAVRIPVTPRAFGQTVMFTVLDCAECALAFAITDDFDQRRRFDGNAFYCPRGHANVFGNGRGRAALEAQIEQLERRAARLGAELDQAHAATAATERSRRALKGQLTRARTRAQNGVCQWCSRSFANVARHVKSRHPDVDPSGEA